MRGVLGTGSSGSGGGGATVTAGTGISVSGSTVTNTGVLSVTSGSASLTTSASTGNVTLSRNTGWQSDGTLYQSSAWGVLLAKTGQTSTTLGVGAIEISSIPSGFNHYRVIVSSRCNNISSNDNIYIRLNSDNTQNYAQTTGYIFPPSIGFAGGSGSGYVAEAYSWSHTILANAGNSNFKTIIMMQDLYNHYAAVNALLSTSQTAPAMWNSTAVVTSISVHCQTSAFTAESYVELWGII